MIFEESAFARLQCIRSQFWYIIWVRMLYVRILHDFRKECTCQDFWALNCCFWLYFAFYVTHEWFEVLLIVQRVLRHTISTSKAWYLHTYTDLHTHLHTTIADYHYRLPPSTIITLWTTYYHQHLPPPSTTAVIYHYDYISPHTGPSRQPSINTYY